MKEHGMMCKHTAETCFYDQLLTEQGFTQKKQLNLSFLLFPFFFSSASLSIWLSHIFLRTQRGMTEEKRDL